MVKAELSYNPYMSETEIKFNGQRPRINSLVEKYQNHLLQDWIDKVPGIFYDEMNGYGFVLEFSGTKTDYDDLKNAFTSVGITEDQVELFHKNELNGRYQKIEEIDRLLSWMEENKNRKFDYKQFREDNAELFDSSYSFVLIHGGTQDTSLFEGKNITVESIDDLQELKNTDLTNTPVLFCLNQDSLKMLPNDLKVILNRKDIKPTQVFFMIHSALNVNNVERTIKDLGIVAPQIIEAVDDAVMQHFFEIYPVTDYISQAIKVFRQEIETLKTQLQTENTESERLNKDVYGQIDVLEETLKKIKEVQSEFIHRDNFDMPEEMRRAKEKLCSNIRNWKNRKTKITKESDADIHAAEMNEAVHKFYREFIDEISKASLYSRLDITAKFQNLYRTAEVDEEYDIGRIQLKETSFGQIPDIADKLMQLKEENYVVPKEDLFGRFFKQTENEVKEAVREVTFFYQNWREYVLTVAEPIANKAIQEQYEMLNDYYNALAEIYQNHLTELIEQKNSEKDKVASQLSEEEQKLQDDNNWLAEVIDQLSMIERG